ncbi:uncharacterized protein LOC131078574 [Cryptomeria japonica]|uniref:uncharacterized protein LOC131078574 n=1 Tax=Cryptomeria japonica TaxID=3369 RepID=UPI0025ACFFFF|nr:uncharacterized protein LOC131078574 [Cryptomeria japonica]
MGGGSPSPSPSPVGSPRGHNIEGDLTNAFNNCRIQPSDPGSSATAAAAAVLTNCGEYPPFSGFRSPHLKHKLKCHFKIKHRHHGPPKIKHRHHEHIKIKHRHGGEKEMHRFRHCHHMNTEAPLGCAFLHQGPHHHGPRPHPPGHPPHHHMRERRHHGHCRSHGYHHFFTGPMGGPGPVPVPVPPPHN